MSSTKQPEQPEHGEYDTDVPDDVQPDYDVDELDDTEDGEQA